MKEIIKTNFLVSVWYILIQLFTQVLEKVVDIHLAASQLSKYPPLFTSTLVSKVNQISIRFKGTVTTCMLHEKEVISWFLQHWEYPSQGQIISLSVIIFIVSTF